MHKVIFRDYTTSNPLTVPERFGNYMESLGAELVRTGMDGWGEDFWSIWIYNDIAISYQNEGRRRSPAEKTVITLYGNRDSISKIEEIIKKEITSRKKRMYPVSSVLS